MNLQSAIKSMKAKDENALVFIYENYAEALLGIIFRILNSEKQSEEVLQQSFMKIWSKIDTYDPDKSTFFTWMARIARNTAIDKVRLKSYERQMETQSLNATIPDQIGQPSHAAIDVEKLTGLLEEKYRIVIDTIYLKGYTHIQASEILNLPIGTIKTRLRKSISILRSTVKNEMAFFNSNIILFILIIHLLWS